MADYHAGPYGIGADGPVATVLKVQASMLSRPSAENAATAIALEMCHVFGCTLVSVGMLDNGALKVIAASAVGEIDQRREATAAIRAAMFEALDQSASVSFPQIGSGFPPINLAHSSLIGSGAGAVCTVPIKGLKKLVGAATLQRTSPPFTLAEIALCEDIASFAGPVLELKFQLERAWWKKAATDLGDRLLARDQLGIRICLMTGALLLVIAVALPVRYRVSGPARLEGSVQRVIVAPAEGFLQQANVRAGDVVREGQVLAEMASQDLELERRRRESELHQHENAYRAAQARNDRPQMVISQSKAGEAQAMLALADSQIDRARIQAPFDGVVIKGDLSQTLGAPVQRGEVLLTIAPNNGFRLTIEVDESDIGAVLSGQSGQLVLAAAPEHALGFVVRRVVPVATSTDVRNYFEVEAALDPQAAALRPGLSGVARIDAGRQTIWWMATRRLFNWVRLSMWSAGL